MDKIKDLMIVAARGAGIPEQIDINGEGLMFKFFVSGRVLIPAIIMQTNINHYRAFGKPLIHIKGSISPDSALPFGCRLDGDIDLAATEYALGYILLNVTATFSELKTYILSGQLDDIALLWKKEVERICSGKSCLVVEDYIHFPPLKPLLK